MIRIVLMVLVFTGVLQAQGNTQISSFSKAKKILRNQVYNTTELQVGFYSRCKYESKKSNNKYKLVVDKKSCGYIPRTKSKRAHFMEWEHIVPAHAFGHSIECWNKGDEKCVSKSGKSFKGRKCCNKISQEFRLIQADMYNLVPAIGELNGDRNNFTFTELEGEPREYGAIDFEVDFKAKKVEPPHYAKGRIARTYLYFNKIYDLPVSKKQMKLYRVWDKQYPMTEKEKMIYKKIEEIQGNRFSF